MKTFRSLWCLSALALPCFFGMNLLNAAPYAVVANTLVQSASIFDIGNPTAPPTVLTPSLDFACRCVAISPDGSTACIGAREINNLGQNFSVIDLASQTIVKSLSLEAYPVAIAFSPDGKTAYVCCEKDADGLYAVVVIDLTNLEKSYSSIPLSAFPNCIAITPDGSKAYVGIGVDPTGEVHVIDLSSNTVVSTINTIQLPQSMAVTPDGTKVYVANNGTDGGLMIIDVATGVVTVSSAIPTASDLYPWSVAVTPDGSKVFALVLDAQGNSLLYGIDVASDTTVFTPIDVTSFYPSSTDVAPILAITPDSAKVSFVNTDDGSIQLFETASGTALSAITGQVGNNSGIAITGILAPSTFMGKLKLVHGGKKLFLKTKWSKSHADHVKKYEIYKLNTKVATIKVDKHRRKMLRIPVPTGGITPTYVLSLDTEYKIRSVDKSGNISSFVQLRVNQ